MCTVEAMSDNTNPSSKWTERMMLDLVRERYTKDPGNGPRYVVAEHVRNETGFGSFDLDHARATGKSTTLRTADALAIDLWPSSGNVVHGFEVKVSRADWLAELRDPSKAEAFRRFCHHWWLVVPDASIVRDDLPEGWGLLVAGKNGRLRAKVSAPRLTPEPMPAGLVASLARAVARTADVRSREEVRQWKRDVRQRERLEQQAKSAARVADVNRDRLRAVRDLHAPDREAGLACRHCETPDPCPTLVALSTPAGAGFALSQSGGAPPGGPIVFNRTEPEIPSASPCEAGHHRWAYLTRGGQACGNCGVPR